MNLGLDGRLAFVAGSSGGLGRAIAETLLAEGARVALNGRNETKLAATLDALRSNAAADVEAFAGDVGAPGEAERILGRVVERMGPVDVLVCNAGGPPPTTFADAPADAWQRALDLNLLSTVHLCRAAVPGMVSRRWGRVICIASIAAKQPAAGLILSTMARAGVLGFAKSLSDEVAASGVTVNALCPGYILTDRVRYLAEARGRTSGRSVDEVLAENAASIPAHRIGRPEEFAAAAAFLASELAGYVTGTAISVDGGWHRSIL